MCTLQAASFQTDVRPLFRDKDIRSMKRFGGFDLSSYADVKLHSDEILARLEAGTMPCDGAWNSASVAIFKEWVTGGFQA